MKHISASGGYCEYRGNFQMGWREGKAFQGHLLQKSAALDIQPCNAGPHQQPWPSRGTWGAWGSCQRDTCACSEPCPYILCCCQAEGGQGETFGLEFDEGSVVQTAWWKWTGKKERSSPLFSEFDTRDVAYRGNVFKWRSSEEMYLNGGRGER